MIEVIFQYDPENPHNGDKPATADEACAQLMAGNTTLAGLFDQEHARHIVPLAAVDYGIGDHAGQAPAQLPMAAVLGCADARVPAELIFGRAANDLFVVRVAGNVPGSECIGSLDYAVEHLRSMRVIAVLGHTGCGAVTAAVDTFLQPADYLHLSANLPLRAIVDSLMAAVRLAAASLEAAHGAGVDARSGYRGALVELSVLLNAAITASAIRTTFAPALSEKLAVKYGVYNLHNRLVGVPAAGGEIRRDDEGAVDAWRAGLFAPPDTDASLETLGRELAQSRFIVTQLQKAA